MASIVELLQLSPTMSEGTLVKWKVKEGDTIKVNQIIAEVETDKAVMEHETFEAGVIRKLVAKEGSKIPVGSALAIVGKADEDISELLAKVTAGGGAAAEAPKEAPKAPAAPASGGRNRAPAPAPAKPAAPAPKAAPAPAPKAAPAPPPAPAAAKAANGSGRVVASPLAKKLAKEAGVDLASVAGSGPSGRIIKRDVETALAAAPAASAPAAAFTAYNFQVGGEVEELPLSNVRRIIAQRLVESKTQVPHFQLDVVVRAERLIEAQRKIREAYKDVKVTPTHFLVKAMAQLAMRHPEIRTQWAGDKLRRLPSAHISVAVAAPDGLVTPVLRDVQAKGLLQIVSEMAEIVGRARERRLKPEEMTGGVQTISNLGMYPISFFTAIINPPESSILAIGAVEDRVFVEDGKMVPGKAFSITMSCDHRVIDGAVGAKYLADLKATLEDPFLLVL
ncbi:MAG: dihydrolipoamide acetyltransferase family protein [Candidatus Sumerlaeia bacterium]|nr:dihydrolipoamide acetyltransferase family protein [Candidatus Sumerlaeia bacterium]